LEVTFLSLPEIYSCSPIGSEYARVCPGVERDLPLVKRKWWTRIYLRVGTVKELLCIAFFITVTVMKFEQLIVAYSLQCSMRKQVTVYASKQDDVKSWSVPNI
jgi:hypothetical protein